VQVEPTEGIWNHYVTTKKRMQIYSEVLVSCLFHIQIT